MPLRTALSLSPSLSLSLSLAHTHTHTHARVHLPTRVLVERYPRMLAIELDDRAVNLLADSLPQLTVLTSDVLQVGYVCVCVRTRARASGYMCVEP